MDKIRALAANRCKEIEQLPRFRWGSVEEMRKLRYPFERGLREYTMILKNLRSILENLPKSAKVLDIGAGLAVALNEIHVQYGLEVIGTGVASRPDSLCPWRWIRSSDCK